MIIYLCIKFQSNIPILSKDIARKPFFKGENFSKLKKGHNTQNNWWILPLIKLDLHFTGMIIYLCIKFQSNTPILSNCVTYGTAGWPGQTDRMDVRTDSSDNICPPLPH